MRVLQPAMWFSISVLIFSLAALAHGQGAQTLDARRQQLNKLVAEEWEYELRESPELATIIGDYRYNDKWSDISLAHVTQTKKDLQDWLARFEAVDTTGFPEQEQLNQSLMVRGLKQRIEDIDLKNYEMPVDQFYGVHLEFAKFVSYIPTDSTKHFEDYLARLHQVPHLVDDLIEVLK